MCVLSACLLPPFSPSVKRLFSQSIVLLCSIELSSLCSVSTNACRMPIYYCLPSNLTFPPGRMINPTSLHFSFCFWHFWCDEMFWDDIRARLRCLSSIVMFPLPFVLVTLYFCCCCCCLLLLHAHARTHTRTIIHLSLPFWTKFSPLFSLSLLYSKTIILCALLHFSFCAMIVETHCDTHIWHTMHTAYVYFCGDALFLRLDVTLPHDRMKRRDRTGLQDWTDWKADRTLSVTVYSVHSYSGLTTPAGGGGSFTHTWQTSYLLCSCSML